MSTVQETELDHPGVGVYERMTGWHVAFWVMLALSAATSFSGSLTTDERIGHLGVHAVLGFAYALIGAPATTQRDRLRSQAYLVVLCLAVGASAAYFPEEMLILFIAFPQVWLLSDRTVDGVVFSVLLITSALVGSLAAIGWSTAALPELLPRMVISLGMTLALGLWISKVVAQSAERAGLLDELATTRGQLAAAHHASGVVAERERLAREIHDTLAQGFTSIVMLAETASTQLVRDRPDLVTAQLTRIEDTARDNLAEARALVAAFSPAALADGTLTDALRRLAARMTAETGMAIDVAVEPDDDAVAALHAGQQVVLLRVAQEALSNVRKHAGASRVNVVVSAPVDGPATIEVRDDGAGFEATVLPLTGFGLAGMRGRVEEAGGTVKVHSEPGRGTRVEVRVPAAASAPVGS